MWINEICPIIQFEWEARLSIRSQVKTQHITRERKKIKENCLWIKFSSAYKKVKCVCISAKRSQSDDLNCLIAPLKTANWN